MERLRLPILTWACHGCGAQEVRREGGKMLPLASPEGHPQYCAGTPRISEKGRGSIHRGNHPNGASIRRVPATQEGLPAVEIADSCQPLPPGRWSSLTCRCTS